jgi:hypothetical protein
MSLFTLTESRVDGIIAPMMGHIRTSRIPVILPTLYGVGKSSKSTLYVPESVYSTMTYDFQLLPKEIFYLPNLCEKNHNSERRIKGTLSTCCLQSGIGRDGVTRSKDVSRANRRRSIDRVWISQKQQSIRPSAGQLSHKRNRDARNGTRST